MTQRFAYIILLGLVIVPLLRAADSLQVAAADSQKTVTPKSNLTAPIKYWADAISLGDQGNMIYLRGHARIVYQDMTLTAAKIRIDQKARVLYAYGVADSVDADSNLVLRGTPVFEETGQEPLKGKVIEYNFDTERGKISMGKTSMEPGFYRGRRINRIADSTLLVEDGIFTSCKNIDHPHYYFRSQRIRLKVKDEVIAEPIVFYIADVPLAWLPFGVFPNKKGRHSGIVIPKYGENRVGGRFLRSMGYYWAPNDYFDASFLTDYYDRLGFGFRSTMRYNVRYKLNGAVSGSYFPRNPSTGAKTERWQFRFSHRQEVDPTLSISGSGNFMSDRSYVKDLSPNVDERLNQNITSSLTLSKRWKGIKSSLTASMSRNENLQTGQVGYVFPSISFNRSKSSIYETLTGEKLGGRKNWYQNIYFSYNSSLIRKGNKIPKSDSTFSESQTQGIQHRMAFSAPQKVFKYISLNPSLSLKEDWVDEIKQARYNEETKEIDVTGKKQFAARHTFSASVNAKTTLFGLFEPNIGSFKYLRHKLDPSVSFNWQPDFSDPDYGYFDYVADSNHVLQKIDRFAGSAFGGTSSSESRRVGLRLGNLFQGKFVDENGKETKRDLLTVNMATGYNYLADSLKWSNLTTNVRTKILGKNISVRMTHGFYRRNANNTRFVNRFERFPKLLTLSTSMGFTLNNRTFSDKKEKEGKKTSAVTPEENGILQDRSQMIERHDYREETKNISVPWSTSLNLNYSYNRLNSANPQRLDLSARANFQLTPSWKISWNGRFDLINQEMSYQRFDIYRDLHCWEMSFGWQPTVGYYSFQINIKSSALKDIKLTKHPTNSSYLR